MAVPAEMLTDYFVNLLVKIKALCYSQCECIASIICQSGQSVGALTQEVVISVVDTSLSPDHFDIHGSASGPRNFAYEVNGQSS